MKYLLGFITLVVVTAPEIWFRFRNRGHHNLINTKSSKDLGESAYLFQNSEQMKRHPAYSKHGLGDSIFFDELQASIKRVQFNPSECLDVKGANINIVRGERITKRKELENGENDVDEHWILLGGSTVLCLEVPDSMTWSSCLQAISDTSSNKAIQVHNFGKAGLKAVKLNLLFPLFLERYPTVTKIIVYFGVNDAGWIAGSRPSNRLSSFGDGVLGLLSAVSKLVAFMHLRFRSRRVCKASIEYANKTVRKFLEYKDYFEAKRVQIDFILQPNVFCKNVPSRLELALIESADPLRIAGMHAAYDTYLSLGDGLIKSAVDAFSDTDESIFIDWCHVGVDGNLIIAKKIWSIVNEISDSDVKTASAMRVMRNHRNAALRSRNIFKNNGETAYNYPLY